MVGLKTHKLIALALGIVVLIVMVYKAQRYFSPKVTPSVTSEHYRAPEKTYRPPIVQLPRPFKKVAQPVASEQLPIPKKQVEKSIEIKTPEGKTIGLVVDKKGDVYVTKDTPKDVEVKVTVWQRPIIDFTIRSGYAAVWNGRALFHCLSLDLVHCKKVSLGGEAGYAKGERLLLGLSAKYRLHNITNHLGINALAGWDFIGKRAYLGVSLSW